ncbi:hypothetical protein [Microbulbifer celer]|uniref:Uncharacterized protein n=1 Tax=Microbulbifer celer TaxID=435905 RepID=A0ABW3U7S4_9GAMM|nr:hypothetical protein [Microbulbifer celer]UFN58569.1 hypothetical protein LPW13_05870 [Microbulbifer celer]
MATKTRTTRTGRVIIELDGCSDYYGGAMVQGALICKVSLPADTDINESINELRALRAPDAGPNYIGAIREALPGVRVLEWRRVQ